MEFKCGMPTLGYGSGSLNKKWLQRIFFFQIHFINFYLPSFSNALAVCCRKKLWKSKFCSRILGLGSERIEKITPIFYSFEFRNANTRWCCKQIHLEANILFAMLTYQFHDFASIPQTMKRV